MDVSDHAIRIARRSVPDATFVVAPLAVEPLPYDDATFGTVIATDVLEHLTPADQNQALDDVFRVLRPGGRWLITTPNLGLIRRVFYRIPDRLEHHFGMRRADAWVRLFESRGWVVRDWWTYLHGMLPFRWRRGGLPELALVVERPADGRHVVDGGEFTD
jgi:SAM-dependent methyltransferase